MAGFMESRALQVRDILALLAVLVRDANEAGMPLTAKAVDFALSIAKSEADTLASEIKNTGFSGDNVVQLPS